ncbi:bifunctional folylpolyglutamate synthase/dihydrofolate synthase [Halanaerobiaceae bacterium Z-7014]|uniref:tetrahydrofolate synthase n=1 Tax=Halonatronomonas betaini TaxID=2778430 RepID=A0A931AT17_9FIRM|nr:folylpolyglutamate synthase/dihydrofolate synthase family protein [Halonatronomonas betaini]MBF8435950.1 bifunctional folylpolyglutamate synthase/dihydrofolate synthase [Halonatronomonas betaini]
MNSAIDFINSLPMFGTEEGFKPGLDRVSKLIELLNIDLKSLDFIHVAGSNGKGSTIEMLNSIYNQAGYKVGRYISPHVRSFNERIQVNGQDITDKELTKLIKEIKPLYDNDKYWHDIGKPTFFEVVTVLAFYHFYLEKPDLILLETGLGGRFDATNVIPSPLLAIITTITLEHTEYLGDKLALIAREKAGIIKEGSRVLVGEIEEEALKVIRDKAASVSANFYESKDFFSLVPVTENLDKQIFKIKYHNKTYELSMPLKGRYQLKNAEVAISATELLQREYPVSFESMKKGFKNVSWPGRLEVIKKAPPVILDGSHTVAGIEELVNFLKDNFSEDHKIKIILAVLKDKDIESMIDKLLFRPGVELIFTENNSFRALKVSDFKIKSQVNIIKSNQKLLETVDQELEKQVDNEILCITGSLSSIIELREHLLNRIRG